MPNYFREEKKKNVWSENEGINYSKDYVIKFSMIKHALCHELFMPSRLRIHDITYIN